MKKIKKISIITVLVITLVFGFTGPSPAQAATAPTLGTVSTYGVVSSTYTNSLNATPETRIVGDVCYTTPPATAPISISGATVTPCTNGVDQSTALSTLNSQSCTSLGTNVVLSGTYTPGCYSSSGSMDIVASTTVTLNGSGVYIFRSGGALTTGANSVVALTGGASASDVFWAPVGATTLGANAATSATPTFVGTIIADALGSAGITLGHFANITGRLLAFGHTVTTDSNTITVPSIVVATGPVFIDTNVNNILDSGEQFFNTIQAAINAATAGNTIVATSGTYTEAVNVTKGVTLRASGVPAIVGSVTLNAAGSKIYGFDITNPNGTSGILINGFGNTEASNNTIHHVGTGGVAGSISGIRFQDINLVDAANIIIQNNIISNIGTILNGTNKGISIEDSAGNSNLTGVTIAGNTISNVTANTTSISPGKGSYGILLSHASHSLVSNMGSTLGAQITGNTISNLNGRWAHGIGLEGSTPSAVLTGNTMSNFTSSSTSNDAAAVVFQDNDGTASVIINNNNFDTNTIAFGVENFVPSINADVAQNYWGVSNINASKFYGLVNFDPWYTNSGMTTLSSVTSGSTVTTVVGDLTIPETSSGAVGLPAGTSNIVLNDNSVLSVASGANTVSGGTIVIAGVPITLSSFTSGSLAGVDLSTSKNIGGQPVVLGTAVQLSSGSSGVPTILTNSALAGASVSIPDDTTILAPSGWNGTIAPPKTGSSAGTTPSGYSVGSTVIDVGSSNSVLLFDKPVLVTLSGVNGNVGYKPAGLSAWTLITNTCGGTYATPTLSAASFPGECSISNGTDTKILTYHFTTFGGLISGPATLHVVKLMVLNNGGIASPSDFTVHLKNSSDVDVLGSPHSGVAAPGTSYSIPAGTYTVSEDANTSYVRTFSTDCVDGSITLAPGEEKICTVINTDIPLPPPTVVPIRGGSGFSARIVPIIGISKVPTPFSLPSGPGAVTYNYTVWNVGGIQSLTKVAVVDDKCSPVVLISGDLNNNGKLDPGENWKYNCSTIISGTTTNTAVVTGHSDDAYNEPAIATVVSTVSVGVPLLSPLINIVKVPSRITPFSFGGGEVMYTYTVTNPGIVAISDVTVIDDKCSLVSKISGDANVNNLLDPSETWVYTCRTNVPVSTRNVATAKGKVNGFIALGYAFATVYVNAPGFPETGNVSNSTSGVGTVKSTFGQSVSSIAGSLRAGSMGDAVKTLQEFLMSQDTQNQALKKYGLDGKFGPTTKAALIKWQKAHDLVGDGILGPKTKAKIKTFIQ